VLDSDIYLSYYLIINMGIFVDIAFSFCEMTCSTSQMHFEEQCSVKFLLFT